MKNRCIIIFVVFVVMTIALSNCTRRRGTSRYRQSVHNRKPIVTQKTSKVNRDTIYMIVPVSPEEKKEFGKDDAEIVFPLAKKLKPLVHSGSLPVPPKILFSCPTNISTREEYINHHNITGTMKELISACDYDNFTVRNNAVALASLSPGDFNLGQICDIFDFCYGNWGYVNDPITRDYYAKASETLKNGLNGDCDDFATLVCSMILAIGGEARISFAYNDKDGHAFAEVNIGRTPRNDVETYLRARYGVADLNHKEEGNDWWLNLDWQGRYPGARYWDYNRGKCFNIIRNTCQEL